ncbi:hypothetical protein ILYODFUR_013172 [Ilyodon furcidens]|uniref:Uncharacterized protein n=1 Tax=Ilyodon furcidens TaxID=33524 RepID=A0ABV0T099_9TELE
MGLCPCWTLQNVQKSKKSQTLQPKDSAFDMDNNMLCAQHPNHQCRGQLSLTGVAGRLVPTSSKDLC